MLLYYLCCKQILDEADRLLSMDFEKSLDEILKAIPRNRRTYLFSATMTNKAGVIYIEIARVFFLFFFLSSSNFFVNMLESS